MGRSGNAAGKRIHSANSSHQSQLYISASQRGYLEIWPCDGPRSLLFMSVNLTEAQETPVADAESSHPVHAWSAGSGEETGAASLEAWASHRLANYQQCIDQLLAVAGPRTIENTLRPFDDAQAELAAVGQQSSLLDSVHPEKAVRDNAQALTQKVSEIGTLTLAQPGGLQGPERHQSGFRGSSHPPLSRAHPPAIPPLRCRPRRRDPRRNQGFAGQSHRTLAGLQPERPGGRQAHPGRPLRS